MLRLIVECHSELACLDEPRSHRVLAGCEYEGEVTKPRIGFKIPRLAEQLDHPQPYDYGLTEKVSSFYRRQCVLFMVRDYKDVVASMLKLRGHKSWLEEWGIPILNHKAETEPDFAHRWREELALCRSSESLVALGALYWAYKNEALLRYLRLQYPVLPIAYETLVSDPRAELNRVCKFLGVAFQETLLEHPQHPHGELSERGLAIGNTDPKRGIDTSSVGQWRDWLSPSDEQLAAEIALPIGNQLAPLLRSPEPLAAAQAEDHPQ